MTVLGKINSYYFKLSFDCFHQREIEKPQDENDRVNEDWAYGNTFQDIENGKLSLTPKSSDNLQYQVRRKRWIRSVRPIDGVSSKGLSQKNIAIKKTVSALNYIPEEEEHSSETGSQYTDDNLSILGGVKLEYEKDDIDDTSTVMDPNEMNYRSGASISSTFSGFYSSSTSTTAMSDLNLRIRDTSLTSIGKQIKLKEIEANQLEDSDNKDWQKYNKPALQIQITELEKYVNNLKSQIEIEVLKGLEYIIELEEELKNYSNRLEEVKKKYFFPQSPITLGQNGIYAALDDFWLENASGNFQLDLIPSKEKPSIKINVSGMNNTGINIRIKAEGFKLAGDKGKRIPKIKMDNLKVTLSLKINIIINFDINSNKWVTNPKEFKVELLSFKGPYGLTQSMVGAILSLVTPMIRTKLIAALPAELGLLLKTLPSPFVVKGEFDITGPELSILSVQLEKSPLLCQIFEYSPSQMDMFHWLQKSIEK